MDERLNKVAALANVEAYDSGGAKKYIDGAPHIKHPSLRVLYANLLTQVYDYAAKYSDTPRVLDLGAGEGSVTLPLLELGARVTAVDISESQLDTLRRKCIHFSNRLEIRCDDISEVVKSKDQQYDIVVANSFLHHVPDYLGMIKEAASLIAPTGQFFSFQDPMRADTISQLEKIFSRLAYFSWRVFKGDVWGGLKRYVRRSRGIYLSDSIHDNAEYHVTRNGVDQTAIMNLLKNAGFTCDTIYYFSTQSPLFQLVGTTIRVRNTFSIIARKSDRNQ